MTRTPPINSESPPQLEYATGGSRTWSVGTLVYDKPAIINVFFWMLWGDFCLNLMDSGVTPALIPLQLDKYGASNASIGFLTGTVVEIMSLAMVAIVSTWSDRHRGALGRRMPFMLYSAPAIALSLIALGFSPAIAHWMQRVSPRFFGQYQMGSVVIGVIAVTMIIYKFFDLFPQSVYYYLFTDVVPQQLMGTFACLFRVVATLGVFVFNWFLLKHVKEHPGAICVFAAVLYLVTFIFMCLMVREGEYPPVVEVERGPLLQRMQGTIRRYVIECYSMSYYWKFYLFTLCFMVGFGPFRQFLILYGLKTLKLPDETYGHIMGIRDIVQVGVFLLLGVVMYRMHPIRAALAGFALVLVATVSSYFFIAGTFSFAILIILTFSAVAVYQGATGALGPRLLPRAQYGQFCSANALVWHAALMGGSWLCGKLIDLAGGNYRLIFLWCASFAAAGFVLLFLLYLDWKKFGGDESYVPPLWDDARGRGFEVAR